MRISTDMQVLHFFLDEICKLLTLAKLSTLNNGPVFLAHPVYSNECTTLHHSSKNRRRE